MTAATDSECCPRFDPAPWQGQEIRWENKVFVRDHVISFLHIPLNFGAVMARSMKRVEDAGAKTAQNLVITEETSLWGADVYIEVSKDVPGAQMATLSGDFLTQVFEGSFGQMSSWIKQMTEFVAGKGKVTKQFLFYYTTCPKCARKYGKNYVVILARV